MTRNQIIALSKRVDEAAEKWGLVKRPTYVVTLDFGNEPVAYDPRVIVLRFGEGENKFTPSRE